MAELEVLTTAQAITIKHLAEVGFDTTDAVAFLWARMDELVVVRQVRDHLRAREASARRS